MTRQQLINRMMNMIINYLPPQKYVKIDDIVTDCYIPRKRSSDHVFDRAIQELICAGRIEACGNAVRINQ